MRVIVGHSGRLCRAEEVLGWPVRRVILQTHIDEVHHIGRKDRREAFVSIEILRTLVTECHPPILTVRDDQKETIRKDHGILLIHIKVGFPNALTDWRALICADTLDMLNRFFRILKRDDGA